MMHTVKELFNINGQKLYTQDYIEANNIPKRNYRDIHNNGGWSCIYHINSSKDQFNYYTAEGKKIGYLYGEKTWFDTKEERDAYRAERNAERVEETKRNKMLKVIMEHYKTLSTEELEKMVAIL